MAVGMPPAVILLGALMTMSLAAWGIIAWVHLVRWLDRRSKHEALLVVVTPHLFRHVGAMAVFPGVTPVSPAWSVPLAWGDGATAVLAALTMVALHRGWRHAIPLAWVFNVFGLLDMLHNGVNAMMLQVAPQLGIAAFVVAFAVPGMFICHVLAFRALLRPVPAA
jgi:hypothetical protein